MALQADAVDADALLLELVDQLHGAVRASPGFHRL